MRKILLAAPIRGKEWAIDSLVESINKLDLSGLDVEAFFLVQRRLGWEEMKPIYHLNMSVTVKGITDPGTEIPQGRPWRSKGSCQYAYMAYIRNMLVIEALRRERDLFSVDSDIILNPDTLQVLAEMDSDRIVSVLVRNHPTAQAYNVMYAKDPLADHVKFTRKGLGDLHNQGIVNCDLTGACSLIPLRLLELVEYSYHPQGEDAGLAASIIHEALPNPRCNTDHSVAHRYTKDITLT